MLLCKYNQYTVYMTNLSPTLININNMLLFRINETNANTNDNKNKLGQVNKKLNSLSEQMNALSKSQVTLNKNQNTLEKNQYKIEKKSTSRYTDLLQRSKSHDTELIKNFNRSLSELDAKFNNICSDYDLKAFSFYKDLNVFNQSVTTRNWPIENLLVHEVYFEIRFFTEITLLSFKNPNMNHSKIIKIVLDKILYQNKLN